MSYDYAEIAGYPVAPYYHPYDGICVEECSDYGPYRGDWDSGDCECTWGFYQNTDDSCYDCRNIDSDCKDCTYAKGVYSCTDCNDPNNMASYHGTSCQSKDLFCSVDLSAQPANLTDTTTLFGLDDTEYVCPLCLPGYTWDPNNNYYCTECGDFISNCTLCATT